ncbi:tRNA (adenosine(37)-N6)-threonylcarbamoyltransferase complex ATPase subunit type 1 TsaE [Sphingosinicella sp. BN140058]|uniref:tRNA (adenosine(37)-N6)-threonylcarbamoyltransferase complex ATPase subunit type 1 TsaE n=1 Tax=Sphingosinicella sp. BN140058 TaxID=1892855 RepID=UPI0010127F75|nr:tRNA (adenosine(37)-N6)-threonylcarbamoyltransferase complex ATPase subunit type 1 TsaE [Sphingosinicella sp. BN140058]QAY79264.1 tRNA (adenosine(37)-N6)-threonylcarbamoyltransferase complex ATPase subunit type 1 TsaE [Sphingosinicella sp. BN140058]
MIRLEGPEATERLGTRLARSLRPGDVVALYGDLGAGKTTFARGVLYGLGFEGDVASPTFPIVLPYDDLTLPIWHVDLYRIDDTQELEELALDEALDGGALLIEWPERMGDLLWRHALRLSLARDGEGARALTAELPPAWETRWPPR